MPATIGRVISHEVTVDPEFETVTLAQYPVPQSESIRVFADRPCGVGVGVGAGRSEQNPKVTVA